jgi:hypothetical protein
MRDVLQKCPYENIKVYSPENKLIFLCNKHRADWYVNKNLASWLCGNAIKLQFSPGGDGIADKPEFLIPVQAICVCCGTDKNLTKHHVLPRCYLKFFPEERKIFNVHDIVLLCASCHDQYEIIAHSLKEEIYQQYFNGDIRPRHISEITKLARVYIRQINNPDKRIPEKIIKKLCAKLRVSDIGLGDIVHIIKYQDKYESIFQNIVKNISDLQSFTVMWRKHFVDTMKPKYLPSYWDINYVNIRTKRRSRKNDSCKI